MQKSADSRLVLDLSKLSEGLPAITPSFGAALAEACAVCLRDQGHQSGVILSVQGDFCDSFVLLFPDVTEQMRRCWNDREYATEQAAYGIALLLIRQLTDLTVVERSRKGTGFDYWLGTASAVDTQPFKKTVRLEVSGIRQGNQQQVRTRVKLKTLQIKPTDNLAPAYIAVVEFSQPLAQVVSQ